MMENTLRLMKFENEKDLISKTQWEKEKEKHSLCMLKDILG